MKLAPGETFPDLDLPDHTGRARFCAFESSGPLSKRDATSTAIRRERSVGKLDDKVVLITGSDAGIGHAGAGQAPALMSQHRQSDRSMR